MRADTHSGPWNASQIDAFLDEARIPIRVGLLRADGWPLVVSVWFCREDDALWCATASDSYLAKRIARDARCGFEIAPEAPPYHGLRGHADAALVPERGDEWRERLAKRYLGDQPSAFSKWLLQQQRPETAICLHPRALISWDYRGRMK